jgi:hypothetical protein
MVIDLCSFLLKLLLGYQSHLEGWMNPSDLPGTSQNLILRGSNHCPMKLSKKKLSSQLVGKTDLTIIMMRGEITEEVAGLMEWDLHLEAKDSQSRLVSGLKIHQDLHQLETVDIQSLVSGHKIHKDMQLEMIDSLSLASRRKVHKDLQIGGVG